MAREFRSLVKGLYYSYINPDLPVLDSLPDDAIQVDKHGDYFSIEGNLEKAQEKPEILDNPFYYCCECKGYISGRPSQHSENSIGPLCGRCGTAYSCVRCGHEFDFNGYMS